MRRIRVEIESPVFVGVDTMATELDPANNPIGTAIYLLQESVGPMDALSIHYTNNQGTPETVKYTILD